MNITTLEQDMAATSASNAFRSLHGMAKARNPYSWWKYVFVALCYYNAKGATFNEVLTDLASIGVGNIQKTYSGLMSKVARGEERDSVARDYTMNLPGVAKTLGLYIVGESYTGSRPAMIFALKNPKLARQILSATYPETVPLFNLLDKKKF
jgi:hypothetical protein